MGTRNAKQTELKILGITQEQIAETLDLSHTTVSDYFNDKHLGRKSKSQIDRYLGELRRKRSNPQDGGPEAA